MMLESYGLQIPRTLPELLTPDKTALIVYDMQVGIVRQVAEAPKIIQNVRFVLNDARRAGVRTFFTRHMSLPKRLMGSFQLRTAMAWQKTEDPEKIQPWFLRDNPAFQIVPELQPNDDEAIFDKLSMSAFEGTPLSFALRDCGIRSFLIAGIALEVGIDPTCRHGADLGFIPILVRDACGAGNASAADHSIASLSHMGDTILSDTTTVCDILSKGSDR